jgi:hypothetical protein
MMRPLKKERMFLVYAMRKQIKTPFLLVGKWYNKIRSYSKGEREMSRIEEIKKKHEESCRDGLFRLYASDIGYLLSQLQMAEESLSKIKDKSQIFASHCAVQLDRHGSVDTSYAFEKSQEIYELSSASIEEIRK